MLSEFPLSLILPALGKKADIEDSLRLLQSRASDVQVIVFGGDEQDLPHVLHLKGDPPETLGQLINVALPLCQGKFLGLLQPGVEIAPGLADVLRGWIDGGGRSNYLYGDYYQRDERGSPKLIRANSCPDDITEREDWGALELYRLSALKELGGCDESIRFRTDYDIRLKLTRIESAVHIEKPLCTVPYRKPQCEPGAAALFFPGRGKFGGFSYLFMDPEEEKEIERIFYGSLRQRQAYLDGPTGIMFPKVPETSPRVSVIIPVHNRSRFLPLAVNSVRQGRFSDFEIVIVDNASTDDTLAVAENLANEDSRIKVMPLLDNIIARALNVGLQKARGEYIAQLDSDDEYTPDTLDVMVSHLDNHRDWALAISYYELMDEGGRILDEFGVIKHLEYDRNNILRVDGAGAVRVWRKAAIEEFGGFNEADFGHYGEDYDLVLKVGEKYEVGRVHEVLYRYRRHPGNSDVLRPHRLKIENKTLARTQAIKRRRIINQSR